MNSARMKQHLKSCTELIGLLYTAVRTHPKIAITFDHSRLGVENKFFLKKITKSPTYTTFYFIKINFWTVPKYNFML